jgi:putative Flp pilus-assembly TadE/G-like protein
MTRRLRSESGQALVVTVVFMVCLLGGVALTLDVGSWYREHRQAQTTADAAALAAAQMLPNTDNAKATAQDYASKNGGGIDAVNGISFSSSQEPDDTVSVRVTRNAPGFFSKIFSIDSATVHARAAARLGVPFAARWVAPIAVNKLHPMLTGAGCASSSPCLGSTWVTTLPLGKTGAPGAFALVNLDVTSNSAIGASTVGQWISQGFNAYLNPDDYLSDPGAKWNDGPIQSAVVGRLNTDLLFPVYDTLTGTGSNAEYHVIGWVGFHIMSEINGGGGSGSITGYFTEMLVDGIQSTSGQSLPDYGVHSIALIN